MPLCLLQLSISTLFLHLLWVHLSLFLLLSTTSSEANQNISRIWFDHSYSSQPSSFPWKIIIVSSCLFFFMTFLPLIFSSHFVLIQNKLKILTNFSIRYLWGHLVQLSFLLILFQFTSLLAVPQNNQCALDLGPLHLLFQMTGKFSLSRVLAHDLQCSTQV